MNKAVRISLLVFRRFLRIFIVVSGLSFLACISISLVLAFVFWANILFDYYGILRLSLAIGFITAMIKIWRGK